MLFLLSPATTGTVVIAIVIALLESGAIFALAVGHVGERYEIQLECL